MAYEQLKELIEKKIREVSEEGGIKDELTLIAKAHIDANEGEIERLRVVFTNKMAQAAGKIQFLNSVQSLIENLEKQEAGFQVPLMLSEWFDWLGTLAFKNIQDYEAAKTNLGVMADSFMRSNEENARACYEALEAAFGEEELKGYGDRLADEWSQFYNSFKNPPVPEDDLIQFSHEDAKNKVDEFEGSIKMLDEHKMSPQTRALFIAAGILLAVGLVALLVFAGPLAAPALALGGVVVGAIGTSVSLPLFMTPLVIGTTILAAGGSLVLSTAMGFLAPTLKNLFDAIVRRVRGKKPASPMLSIGDAAQNIESDEKKVGHLGGPTVSIETILHGSQEKVRELEKGKEAEGSEESPQKLKSLTRSSSCPSLFTRPKSDQDQVQNLPRPVKNALSRSGNH
ncbi:MAG: hypothetical protein A3E85_00940 [Gammaproteobacteria bacterium RIFCSPHIGHO2_12_FULL_45_12]|nr:MAG: hypothetical protein A3E85_00940 [Gammaproteobacteria bacterium RIFCSPHIGHO2_12_FULL_45_12]